MLPFQGLDPALAGEGAAAAEHLVTRIYGRRGVELVERNRLQQVLGESRLALTGAVDPRTAKELGRLLGADALMLGTVVRGADAGLDLEARIVEVETGKVLAASHARVEASGTPAPAVERPQPPAPPARLVQALSADWETGRDLGPGDRLPWTMRTFGTTAAVGRLFVVGGQHADMQGTTRGLREVYSAPIGDDGRLGHWRADEPLPEGRYQVAAAASGRFVFAVGGYDQSLKGDVFAAEVKTDGRLGAWRRVGALPAAGTGCEAQGGSGFIVVAGCSESGGFKPELHFAAVAEDGSLGPWSTLPTPPHVLGRRMAASPGRLYLVGGGRGGSDYTADVYSSRLSAGGVGGGFRREAALPKKGYYFGAAVIAGRLWAAGGGDYAVPSGDVFSAALDKAGRVGTWRREPLRLAPPRPPAVMPAWRGRGYLVGDLDGLSRAVVVLPDDDSGRR